MIESLHILRELTFWSVTMRLLLAFLCGGAIGIEREFKRRPAGFRTHILICLGAAMTTLTSQYLYLVMHYPTDMARLGAQVVAGIGFIGAGTIIVTKRQRVKGLTTAAGLWAAAIIGLTIGAGFYEGGVLATVMILVAELVFSRLEYRIMRNSPEVNLFVEYREKSALDRILALYQEQGARVMNLEITRASGEDGHSSCAVFYLRLDKGCAADRLLDRVRATQGVVLVEEL